ncbi:hypothetical protein MKW98_014399 [Papaver atlanticum]|uniref:Uncharacterized protein n=1 Tax=Papaver atlanticum TaxID=357466 RepID=A0AAD4SPC9_9MAGN|nr:hypothetical protein MKW98_014399 [Papaver atlanticum]
MEFLVRIASLRCNDCLRVTSSLVVRTWRVTLLVITSSARLLSLHSSSPFQSPLYFKTHSLSLSFSGEENQNHQIEESLGVL